MHTLAPYVCRRYGGCVGCGDDRHRATIATLLVVVWAIIFFVIPTNPWPSPTNLVNFVFSGVI